MIFEIFLTLFLVLLNGFFVAAEFAMVKVRSSQIEIEVAEGNRLAPIARHIVDHLDAYLSATQLGITLASLGLGWIGEDVVSQLVIAFFELINYNLNPETAHRIALPLSFAIITVLHIVFGELAPKSLAIRYPLQVTMGVSLPMRIFRFIFGPFIWLLNGMANLFLKLIGVRPMSEHDSHTEEEIRYILDESLVGGHIRDSERELIENVFRFDESTVKKIMIPRTRVVAIKHDSTRDEVWRTFLEEGYSRLPVYEGSIDKIIGVLYSKDFIKQLDGQEFDLSKVMRTPYFLPESKKINELLRDFQRSRQHMGIVVDEFGGTAGIVTLEDILEEIVGDINDESDQEAEGIIKTTKNEWQVEAITSVEDLNRQLPRPLPLGEDYDTIAGLLYEHFGRIPEVGEAATIDNYTITVLSKSSSNLDFLQVVLHEPEFED